MILLLSGCMTLDGFFFNPTPVDAYGLSAAVIPSENLEEVAFSAVDGRALYGVWAHAEEPGMPVVIYFHGNTGNIDDEYNYSIFERLWTFGYEVFVFDYGGYGKSSGTPSYDSVISDGGAAISYVEEATGLDHTEINYYGTSLGGFSSIQNSTILPPRVLITDSMFASAGVLGDAAAGLDLPKGWFFQPAAAAREYLRAR